MSTHAIGDKAIDWVVDTYAQALAARPTKGLRHGIIHANTPTNHAIDEMARLQRDYDAGFPEASAGFMWWIGDTYAGNFGLVRNARMKPLATWQKKGIRWGGGSDFSVTPFAARYGLWASVARETLNGTFGKTPFGLVGVRMAKPIGIHDGGGTIRNSEGNVDEQGDNGCFWKRARWCDYSGPIDRKSVV